MEGPHEQLPPNTRKVPKPSPEELERAIQAANRKYEKKAPHLHQERSTRRRQYK